MSARPPPTRPHIGLNSSSHFDYPGSDWREDDDAWNSSSDEEPSSSAWRPSQTRSSSATAPKPVPKSQPNSSSSTLASSYTHVVVPSPSSYPSHAEQARPPPSRQGWTIISSSREGSEQGKHNEAKQSPDGDGDLILGDLDPEELAGEDQTLQQVRTKQSTQPTPAIRADVDEIVKGRPVVQYPR